MTEATGGTRGELLEEYFKVVDILQSYDPYFLTIKNWELQSQVQRLPSASPRRPPLRFSLYVSSLLGFGPQRFGSNSSSSATLSVRRNSSAICLTRTHPPQRFDRLVS